MPVVSIPPPAWQRPTEPFSLGRGMVHLWRKTLAPLSVEACETLAPSEWTRAARFHFQRDRDRYLGTRVFVRAILGRYLAEAPASLQFGAAEHGKPFLAQGGEACRFNLAHSGDLLLLAVARAEVGVDVEQMRPEVPFEDLARHFFSEEVAEEIKGLDPDARPARFYELWTAAEARLKGAGTGLMGALEKLPVKGWCWGNLPMEEGYAGALAVEGEDFRLECWDGGEI